MEYLIVFVIVVYWIGLAGVNSSIAKAKGESPSVFFFSSLFFGPLIYLLLLAMPHKT